MPTGAWAREYGGAVIVLYSAVNGARRRPAAAARGLRAGSRLMPSTENLIVAMPAWDTVVSGGVQGVVGVLVGYPFDTFKVRHPHPVQKS